MRFQPITDGIWQVRTPLGKAWSGVTLVVGPEGRFLIDSGVNAAVVDDCIVPALAEMSLQLADIDALLCTHTHGDHLGGHARIHALAPSIRIVAWQGQVDPLRHPREYSRRIRAVFPEHSAPVPDVLDGVEPDQIVQDEEIFAGRLQCIHTPGHDADTVCWFDLPTRTLITGDSLQLHGTQSQGTALVMDLRGYRGSLCRLYRLPIERILTGHDYLPLGNMAEGAPAVRAYLDACGAIMDEYQQFVCDAWAQGDHDAPSIARKLIAHIGGTVPAYLFLPLYTVAQCIHNIDA